MLQFLQSWRERGWRVIDASTYSEVWQRYGGSVATHPEVIERLAGL
ncbi:MAG: GNAT family N-acetyltransferase, partial [Gammaproteobacteria bacterium HGW-Gammaproteobacteria-5]